jgi:hypothetical protein
MKPVFSSALMAGLLVAVLPAQAAADKDAAAGRALMQRYADAIVSVELVVTLKLKQGDRELPAREQRVDINGTVISPGGLTVTSLAAVDPQTSLEAMRSGPPGFRTELVGADFKEVKLRLADGQEIPARFVLKDADLDLAFMAPTPDAPGAQRPFPHVDLAKEVEGAVLGRYFFVGRAAKTLQRVPIVRATEVIGIVERPRRLYLVSNQSMGTPVFDLNGRVLGISLQHFASGRSSGLIVLPAGDIADMAKQAVAAQMKVGGSD